MLFQVLCGFEPIFYTTHPNEESLNIRNCIMHGLGETFDYLNIGIVAIMFQLLWDVAACEIFID